MTAQERTGWRDHDFALRHRSYGFNAPFQDVDSIWVEYDRCRPMVLCEFKLRDTPSVEVETTVLRNLAEMADLPAVAVRYWPPDPQGDVGPADLPGWTFKVWALNPRARAVTGERNPVYMSEAQYVAMLYRFRERAMPAALREWLERPFTDEAEAIPRPNV